MTRVHPTSRRCAFTLVEAVMIVLVLAIAVPPTLGVLMSGASSRADTINTSRATMLASVVLEGVVADVSSDSAGRGFGALADSAAYLESGGTGFYDRMTRAAQPYTDLGLTYSVEIGPLVANTGVATGDPGKDIFRTITVRVTYPSATGLDHVLPVSVMVGEI